jgi:predicted phage-related endonuclease
MSDHSYSLTTMNTVDLASVRGHVETLKFVKAKMAALKELEKQARAAIEEAMGEHEVGMLDDEPVVHWSRFKEQRFDQSAFGDEYPDLLEQYKTAREKRRFEVL